MQTCESCETRHTREYVTCDCGRKVCIYCINKNEKVSNIFCKRCYTDHYYALEVTTQECSVCKEKKTHGSLPLPNIGWCGTGFNRKLYWHQCWNKNGCESVICSRCVKKQQCEREQCGMMFCSESCKDTHYYDPKKEIHKCQGTCGKEYNFGRHVAQSGCPRTYREM